MTEAEEHRNAPVGRWRIVHMDVWDQDALDLVNEAYVEVHPNGYGSFGFIAVEGDIDYRLEQSDSGPLLQFSWDGFDDSDAASGRGWLRRVPAGGEQ